MPLGRTITVIFFPQLSLLCRHLCPDLPAPSGRVRERFHILGLRIHSFSKIWDFLTGPFCIRKASVSWQATRQVGWNRSQSTPICRPWKNVYLYNIYIIRSTIHWPSLSCQLRVQKESYMSARSSWLTRIYIDYIISDYISIYILSYIDFRSSKHLSLKRSSMVTSVVLRFLCRCPMGCGGSRRKAVRSFLREGRWEIGRAGGADGDELNLLLLGHN